MRVGISTTIVANELTGGLAEYLNALLTHLPCLSSSHEYVLLSTRDDAEIFRCQSNRIRQVIVPSIIRHPMVNIAWHAVAYSKILRKWKVDIIHIPDFRRFVTGASVPVVVTIHDMTRYILTDKYDPVRMFYHRRILPSFLKRFAHVIAISENTKHDVLRFFPFLEDHISVVYDGISTSLYKSLPRDLVETVRSKLHLPRHYVLYVSRIEHPAKNHVGLIEAFRSLKQSTNLPHKLVLVGSPSFRSQEVYEAARSLGDQIMFTGFVSTQDLPAVYNAADAFVFPSLYEGFGLPVLEAMACGVPVAASNVSAVPEVAGEAAILFDPYDIREITQAMGRLLTDNDLRDALRQRGFERAKEFSWEKTARETLAVYEQVYTQYRLWEDKRQVRGQRFCHAGAGQRGSGPGLTACSG